MKISYNWLKWYVDGELPAPEKLEEIFTFKLCEVEGTEKLVDGDTVFDLNILPNRAHDLLSHQGVAREVAGMLGLKFKDPTELYKVPVSKPTNLKIEIKTPACRRYMGRIVRNIKVGPSPEWVVKHLESIGQRSINNIVDATNLVMFDCGQPCHAFDLKQVPQIVVANAKEGEEFPVLGRDQIVAKLKESDMMITDGANSLAIAGVKGGLNSGVTDATTEIVLEVANFDPVSVRKTARRLNLLSDSAKRFENDLSPEHASYAMRELSATILEMCPEAEFEEIVDVYPTLQQSRTVSFSPSWIKKYLGISISPEEVISILKNYGYEISETGLPAQAGDLYTLSVPALRLDITGRHDIAEEVARLYDLKNINPVPLSLTEKPKVNKEVYMRLAARKKLLEAGFRETLTYAFRKKGAYEVARGVGDKGALRTNLSDGLKESYEFNRLNAPVLGLTEIKIFEIGVVWPKSGEEIHVAFADTKGVTEMALNEYCEKNNISAGDSYGELLGTDYSLLATARFAPWSLFPFITRDIAVWVPEGVDPEELAFLYKKYGTELLVREPQLFDQFTKDGKTSYAFRMVFQSNEKTLTDAEIEPIMSEYANKIIEKGWTIR
jgi:phenylalanyl-tRNA synthetase beta subunit